MRTPLSLLLTTVALLSMAQPGPRVMNQAELAEAQELYMRGDLDSAMAAVDRVIAKDSKLAAAFKLRGDIKQKDKDLKGALDDYKIAEGLDPNDPRLYVSRSAARISDGNLKGALKDLDRAITLDPNDPDVYYNRACAYYLGSDSKSALKDAEKTIKLKPDHAEALYLRGVIKGEDYREEAGLDDIGAALALNPEIPGGRMSEAVLLYELKRYEAAIKSFDAVIATDSTELKAAHYYRGDSYYELGNKEKACADWDISAKLGDKDAIFIKKNYCETDAEKIPKKPDRKRRRSVIHF